MRAQDLIYRLQDWIEMSVDPDINVILKNEEGYTFYIDAVEDHEAPQKHIALRFKNFLSEEGLQLVNTEGYDGRKRS